MYRLFLSECRKIRWALISLLILAETFVSFFLAAESVESLAYYFPKNWNTLYFQAVLYHGMFFLPFFTGIFAAFLCFYEHKNGAWKQLLTIPIPRYKIFLSKFLMLIVILAFQQVLFLAGYLIAGNIIHTQDSVPWKTVITGVIGGWLSIFPLAMLQVHLCTRFKSFGTALLFNISMVIPNIVITGLPSWLGAWFPFAPPYYAMFPQGINLSPRLDPYSFSAILILTFSLSLILGIRSFVRRQWTN